MADPLMIRYRAVSELVPYARNSRTHSDAQLAQIAGSIREFGFTNPVLVDSDGGIIAGHGRVLAAQRLGLEQVPTVVLGHLTQVQRQAYVIADNQLALNAGWNLDMLRLEIGELPTGGFDVGMLGFDDAFLEALSSPGTGGRTDPDDAPEAPVDPVSVLGDLWVLGRHRILCGSSTVATDVGRVLGDVKPHLMVTDPPYGVNYEPKWRREAGVGSKGGATGVVLNDDQADWREAWALFPGDVAYVWHAGTQAGAVADSLAAVKFKVRAQIVWVKTRHVLSRGDYHHQHEPAFYATRDASEDDGWRFVPEHEIATYSVKAGKVGHWTGGRKQSTVWFIEHIKSETGHGTQKPVEAMRRPIENNSSPGQAVYEPFSGSGTTIIAAEMTGRACHAIELNPAYVDVAVKRWQEFTGGTAVLEGDGRTFDEVAGVRVPAGARA